MMNLEDFIADAIKGISAGISKGREEAVQNGVFIGQALYGDSVDKLSTETKTKHPIPEFIEFDIAVSISKEGEARAQITVIGIDFGKIAGALKQETISHIRFNVPVHWEKPDPHLWTEYLPKTAPMNNHPSQRRMLPQDHTPRRW